MKKVNPALLRYELGPRALLEEVVAQIQRMLDLAMAHEKVLTVPVPSISGWSISNHLEHLVITGRSAVVMLERSLVSDLTSPGRNADGDLLFDLLYLPRGQTQAPEFAWPKGMDHKKLCSSLKRLYSQVKDLEGRLDSLVASTGRVLHPYLGNLTAREWLAFIGIHQNHHLCIASELADAVKPA